MSSVASTPLDLYEVRMGLVGGGFEEGGTTIFSSGGLVLVVV